ncbi:MAG: hypothetical protein JWQ98_3144 [Chlorobi bacterium]|nr:hypothetical protein [Chlorobiota bacterium]
MQELRAWLRNLAFFFSKPRKGAIPGALGMVHGAIPHAGAMAPLRGLAEKSHLLFSKPRRGAIPGALGIAQRTIFAAVVGISSRKNFLAG